MRYISEARPLLAGDLVSSLKLGGVQTRTLTCDYSAHPRQKPARFLLGAACRLHSKDSRRLVRSPITELRSRIDKTLGFTNSFLDEGPKVQDRPKRSTSLKSCSFGRPISWTISSSRNRHAEIELGRYQTESRIRLKNVAASHSVKSCSSRLSSSVRFLILRVSARFPVRVADDFLTVGIFVGLVGIAYDSRLAALRRAPAERSGRKWTSRPSRVSSTP